MCIGISFFGVKHSLIHLYNFFPVLGGSVSVGQHAFLFWGHSK